MTYCLIVLLLKLYKLVSKVLKKPISENRLSEQEVFISA